MELHQLLERIDPFHRRHMLSRKKQQWRHNDIWFYTTARTFTNIGLFYEPYFPRSLRFLVENPLTGGKPLEETGRPGVSLYDFADNEFVPAASELNKLEKVGKSSPRKGSGPRTAQGKLHSKYNAVKHGVFSKKLLIKGESLADNKALWDGLWEDFKPKGTLATEIFMDIFLLRLNNRRFHKARNAKLAEKVQFSEIDGREMQQAHAWYLERWARFEDGMLKPGGNQFVLKRCLEILEEVRCSVEKHGFILKKDGDLLRKLFGDDMDGTPLGLADFYRLLAARCAPLVEGEEGNVDADKLKRIMLRLLDFEIERVITLEKAVQGRERLRRKYIVDQAFVLSQEASDLDMRYEAHFSRELARKLILFEQAQSMTNGIRVLPTGNVDDKL